VFLREKESIVGMRIRGDESEGEKVCKKEIEGDKKRSAG
jgi:hypothetical protein